MSGNDYHRAQVNPTTSPPYAWICHLEIQHGDGAEPVRGSGFKINIPDLKYTVVVTAGSCVYDCDRKAYAKQITATFPGQEPIVAIKLYAPLKYINSKDEDFDYGLILLPGNSDDGFGWSTEMTSEICIVTICGYPGDKPKGSMWITGGEIAEVTSQHVCYTNDKVSEQSGSPIYTWYEGFWTVIAVHAKTRRSDNLGTRLAFKTISHIVREAGVVKVIGSVNFPNVYLRCGGEVEHMGKGKVDAQYGITESEQRFYIYPVHMLPSLAIAPKNHEVVIESAKWEGMFVRLDGHDMHEHKKSGGGVVNCQTEAGKFLLKDESQNEDGSQVSIISVDFPNCRIRLNGTFFKTRLPLPGGKSVNCQYYEDMEEPLKHSSFERFRIATAP